MSSPRAGWGGTATLALSLARGLEERGHHVVIICKPGSALHRRMAGRYPCEPILYGKDVPLAPAIRARRVLVRHRTDVVLSLLRMDLKLTPVAARSLGVPVVAHRAELEPFRRPADPRTLLDRLPTHWVANSVANRDVMLRTGHWLAPDDVSMIHNGIDAAPYIAAQPASLDLPADAIAVGYIGRLVIEKGLPELARAWHIAAAADPRLHLLIAGEGRHEEEFRRGLAGAPRVHWLGFRADVPSLLKAMDVVVMPSWEEPFGLVATEAMAAGVPVIAAGSGGLAEVVADGETGVLVPPRDSARLGEAMIRLASDEAARRRMGAAAVQRVLREFSEDAMVDAYERVFSAACARPAKKSSFR